MKDPVIALPHWLGAKKANWDEIYLPLSIASIAKSQPISREIFYIDANPGFPIHAKGRISSVATERLESEDINKLIDSYVHLSTNHHDFELRSIIRMLYLRNLMDLLGIESAFTVESDVLVLEDLSIIFSTEKPQGVDAALTALKCPATAWFTRDYLDYYCDMVLKTYTGSLIKKLSSWFPRYLEKGGKGGICDMTFHGYAIKKEHGFENNYSIIDSSVPHPTRMNGSPEFIAFDNMLRTPSLGEHKIVSEIEPRTNSSVKKVDFDNHGHARVTTETGQRIYMGSIHFQGSTKSLMGRYFANIG